MRVPVRRLPQTHVSEQQQGFERAVQPLDTNPLTHVIEGFRNQLVEEQDSRQRIGLNRELLQEVNGLQEDFVAREHDPAVSSIDFAHNTETAYEQRHTELVNRLRSEGYHGDALDEFETRLGTVRQGFHERALVHQVAQLRSRAGEEITDTGRSASQYAAADPIHNYATARDMLDQSIQTHPDLTEEDRVTLRDQQHAILQDGAAAAWAIQDPQTIINFLDPHGLTAPTPPATAAAPTTGAPTGAAPTASFANPAAFANDQRRLVASVIGGAEGGAYDRWNQAGADVHGRYQIWGPTWVDTYKRVHPGSTREQAIAARSNPAEQDAVMNQLLAGYETKLTQNHLPPTAENMYVLHWFGEAGGIRALLNPSQPVTNITHNLRQNGLTANMTAGEAIARGTTRIRHAEGQVQVAAAEPDRAGAAMAGGSQLTPDIQNVDLPPSSSPTGATVPPAEPTHDISSIHTGNPLLDDLNGPQRIRLLSLAREQMNRVTATQRAQMDVTIGNITAEAMNNGGEIATPIPSEADVLRVYGPVEGPQHWAQIQQSHAVGQAITTFRTQSATDIQHSLDAIRPTPGSPTYATQLQIYDHAQMAAQALLTQREHDPAGYVMQYFPDVRAAAQQGTPQYYAALDRAYAALGIDPNTAPVMTTEQSREMATQYRTMSPDLRRQFMVQNWTMGEDRFRRFVHGMEGTTAEADANIFALLRSYPRGAGPSSIIFQDVLIGRDAIAQDPARKPKSEEVTAAFRTQGIDAIRDLNPEASRAIQDAAEGLYVQRGGNNRDGSLNAPLYGEALRTVLGGSLPVAMGHGRASQYRTILPPGVNEPQFRGWVDRQTLYSLSVAAGNRAPYYGDLRTPAQIQDIIDDGTFVMTSPGHYMVRMASDGRPLMTRSGQPFLLNVDLRAARSVTPARSVASPTHPLNIHGAGVVR